MVGQQDRLGLLQVRVTGEISLAHLVGSGGQRVLECRHEASQVCQFPQCPQPEVGGHLVVPTPPGVQPGAGITGQFGDPPLYGRVDVLVRQLEVEGPIGQFGLGGIQRMQNRCGVGIGHETDPGQHPDMGPRAGHVLPVHPTVKRQAVVEGL